MRNYLLELLPSHDVYVEAFAGAGQLLFAKTPSKLEVYNDLRADLVNMFRVLRDPLKFKKFYRMVNLSLYARKDYDNFLQEYKNGDVDRKDDVTRAYQFYLMSRQSFSGKIISGWSYAKKTDGRSRSITTSRFYGSISMLPQIHDRLKNVQIEYKDFREIFEIYDGDDVCFYLDPPYLHSTRSSTATNAYLHEMTEQDHIDLLTILHKTKGKWMLSGYRSPLYNEMLKNFNSIDIELPCFTQKVDDSSDNEEEITRDKRVETVWFNFEEKQGKLFGGLKWQKREKN